MKIMVVGANGTIGRAVADLLANDDEVIRVGHSGGDFTVDLESKESIDRLVAAVGTVDAIVCAAGASRFGSVTEASDADFAAGLANKLMGQVNLVRAGIRVLPDSGSITLTGGLLAQSPWPGTAPTALVNAALEGFVRAAALDLPEGYRINVVSPILVTETAHRMGMGTAGTMSAAETANAYAAAVSGDMTGKVLDVRDFGRGVDSD